MKLLSRIFTAILLLVLLAVPLLFSQTSSQTGTQTGSDADSSRQPVPGLNGSSASPDANTDIAPDPGGDRMLTPPPVSGQSYPVALTSEERSNYFRGGVAFSTAYSDNVIGSVVGHPVSDVSYSIWPTLALEETTPRLHSLLTYAPGFTFYQRTSSRNEDDENVGINVQYRLSPHVTLSAVDNFQKSSNVFNQPDLGSSASITGGTDGANVSIIAPIADRLSNAGNLGLTYQFALNQMVGASGTFSNLHYPNPSQVPGLFDAASQGGSAFYALRVSKMNYAGVTYQYQRLLSYPTDAGNETQTHAFLFFYTFYVSSRFSVSLFGGPQYSDTMQTSLSAMELPLPSLTRWTPAAGASVSWQARMNSVALSYSHSIAGGGGLPGAVKMDSASASLRQQITRGLSGTVAGTYAQNTLLDALIAGSQDNGHSISGTAALQQQFGQNLTLQLGYTRLHQSYGNIAVLALTPDTNREFISLAYQFSRPLGR